MDRSAAVKRILTLLALLLPACCGAEPQLLGFNYVVRTVPDASALINSVQGGATSVSDLLSPNPCNFTADFSIPPPPLPPTAPQVSIYGEPGRTGFNVNIISTTPVAIPTTGNPPNCTAIREFEINIGGPSETLTLGALTSSQNGRVFLTDGSQFVTSQFFQARVQGFDPSSRRSDGDFRFIDRLSAGSNKVLIAQGSYALTPH